MAKPCMFFIIFRRRDHYPELCSRHGASLHENRRCFLRVFHAKEASEGARHAHDRWRPYTRPTRPLRVSLARKTRENRTVISVFSLFLSLSFTLLKRHHIVCLQAALSRTAPRAMMALLESLTVWHEDDYKLTEILPFASLVIKLRKEGWKQKCKWSIETSPNALQVRRNIHFFVTEFKILWKYPQQMKRKKEEAEEKRSSITIRISKLLRL